MSMKSQLLALKGSFPQPFDKLGHFYRRTFAHQIFDSFRFPPYSFLNLFRHPPKILGDLVQTKGAKSRFFFNILPQRKNHIELDLMLQARPFLRFPLNLQNL
ncbi:MAG: hypothetical protein HGA90_02030, partial [Alphaproteobacteria bacterium]|nr:hypothetical protein [Alphaproteobacteria bacterium]